MFACCCGVFLLSIFHDSVLGWPQKLQSYFVKKKFPILCWLQGFCCIAQNMDFLKMQTRPLPALFPRLHTICHLKYPGFRSVCQLQYKIQPGFCNVHHLQHKIHPGFCNVRWLQHKIHPGFCNVRWLQHKLHPGFCNVRWLQHKIHPGFCIASDRFL